MISKKSILVSFILFLIGLVIGMVIGTGLCDDACEFNEEPEQIHEKVYFYCEAECMHIIKEGELIEVEDAKP